MHRYYILCPCADNPIGSLNSPLFISSCPPLNSHCLQLSVDTKNVSRSSLPVEIINNFQCKHTTTPTNFFIRKVFPWSYGNVISSYSTVEKNTREFQPLCWRKFLRKISLFSHIPSEIPPTVQDLTGNAWVLRVIPWLRNTKPLQKGGAVANLWQITVFSPSLVKFLTECGWRGKIFKVI